MHCLLLLAGLLAGAPEAGAQGPGLFRRGGKGSEVREEILDKRFGRSKVAKLLQQGTEHPGCRQLLAGLLTALGEIGPTLHRYDANFALDPTLQTVVATQLSTAEYPAMATLVAMVRRVLIDGAMPRPWLETAEELAEAGAPIDLAKLRYLADGVTLVDNNAFSIELLRQRYILDVLAANAAVRRSVMGPFRDTYLDRDVLWSGLTVVEAGVQTQSRRPPPRSGAAAAEALPPARSDFVVALEYVPPDYAPPQVNLVGGGPPPAPLPGHGPIRVYAKLHPRQYVDLERAFRGRRMLLKGKLWELNQSLSEVEVRDGLIFEERTFGEGLVLAQPEVVATCPAAVNDLAGLAPNQPGGFGR